MPRLPGAGHGAVVASRVGWPSVTDGESICDRFVPGITLPILRALATAGPVGCIHFDAHADTLDTLLGVGIEMDKIGRAHV